MDVTRKGWRNLTHLHQPFRICTILKLHHRPIDGCDTERLAKFDASLRNKSQGTQDRWPFCARDWASPCSVAMLRPSVAQGPLRTHWPCASCTIYIHSVYLCIDFNKELLCLC